MSFNSSNKEPEKSNRWIFYVCLLLAIFCSCIFFGSWYIDTGNHVYRTGKYANESQASTCSVENHVGMKSGDSYTSTIPLKQCTLYQESVEIGNYEQNIPFITAQVDMRSAGDPSTWESSEYIFNIKTPNETLDPNGNLTIIVTKK